MQALLLTQQASRLTRLALESLDPFLDSLSFFVRELLDPHVSRPVRHVEQYWTKGLAGGGGLRANETPTSDACAQSGF